MRVEVKVIPRAKRDCVSEENGKLKVYVKAPAIDNRANKALIEVLARYFNVKKGNIRIVKGEKSREKIIEIDVDDPEHDDADRPGARRKGENKNEHTGELG